MCSEKLYKGTLCAGWRKRYKSITWIYRLRWYGSLANRMLECVENKKGERTGLNEEKITIRTVFSYTLIPLFWPLRRPSFDWRVQKYMCYVYGGGQSIPVTAHWHCKKSAYVTTVNTENVLMHQWRWIIVNSSGALALVSTCCCLWLAAAHQLPRVLWPGWVSRTPRCPHSALRQRSQPQLPSHTSLPSWPWAVEKHRHQPCLPSSH